ncbi:hypothetical protein C5167_015817 [Papaver somniferum]|uniref:ATPase AAA-type core domain-containing protein n=1 Tax=Papaver somniferum TaxID=3469 RepID=A0A4Y7JA81_PAPSO|nr:hypothetical protein C5167_015805 [Papaver somniferum]RZC56962.1 hypothetical protein C5167_015817 [Papaver somniferum]
MAVKEEGYTNIGGGGDFRSIQTGNTVMARACVAETNATFLKLAGPQLVQMFIGDRAKFVRDAFKLVKEKDLSSSSSMRLTQLDLSDLMGT